MPSKLCPRCKQKDTTDFSTCRFCGFKYDAVLPKAKTGMGFKIGYWPLIFILFSTVWMFKYQMINAVGFVATGGKEKNIMKSLAINVAVGTAGSLGIDPKQFKSDLLEVTTAIESDRPIDEELIKRMAASGHISVDQERAELEKLRAEYKHKHHLD